MSLKSDTKELPRRVSVLVSNLGNLRDDVPDSTTDLASSIDRNFATEVLVAAWDQTLHGSPPSDHRFRPALKTALRSVHETGGGSGRSSKQLARLVAAAYRENGDKYEVLTGKWDFSDPERRVVFEATGATMQLAPVIRELWGLESGLTYAAAKALGEVSVAPPHGRLQDFAGRLDRLPNSRELWREIYLRMGLNVNLLRHYPKSEGRACILPYGMFHQGVFARSDAEVLAFTEEDIKEMVGFQGFSHEEDIDLVIRPVFDIGRGYVTSGQLLLDSLTPRISQWVFDSGAWQSVVTDAFESRVIDLARASGLLAGSVSVQGHWDTGVSAGSMADAIRAAGSSCPGEIDVLAFDGDGLVLLECKSLYPLAKVLNTAGRVSDEDIEGWIGKVRKKVAWASNASGLPVAWAAVVVEGVEITDSLAGRGDVDVVDASTLSHLLTKFAEMQGP